MIRFYLGLWAAKLLLFFLKIQKKQQDDKPGLLAYRFTNDFLKYIKKPPIVIAVTGTNGKTTVSNMVAEMLKKDGKVVCYNDWGANTKAGAARCLLDAVTIFNRSKSDAVVLEVDEITSGSMFPYVNPNIIIVTNLFRDSMYRNAHSKFVFDRINPYLGKATLILNGDDPISSALGSENNKKIYFGIEQLFYEKLKNNIVCDFNICPKCHEKVIYRFKRYHHIGKFYCPNCGFASVYNDYNITKINNDKTMITLKYKNKNYNIPVMNDSIFNLYNVLSVVACFHELGYSFEKIEKLLKDQEIVASRYSDTKVNEVTISTIATKGLNAVACSRVFDYVSEIKEDMEIILVVDDTFDRVNGSEAINWIYDADFEFLNQPNLKRIIVGGVRRYDYNLRLLLAGIDQNKIVLEEKEEDCYKHLLLDGTKRVLILHEVYYITGAHQMKEKIKKILLNKGENREN